MTNKNLKSNKKMTPFIPHTVLVENKAKKYHMTTQILSKLHNAQIVIIETIAEYLEKKTNNFSPETTLVLAHHEGKFLKPCPCTKKHIGCHYNFLNIGTHCHVGCSYCILQGYLNNPYLTIHVNLEDMIHELHSVLENRNNFFRIGTGELTDSLFLDPISEYSTRLIPFFLKHQNAVLELKTKTIFIDNLLQYKPQKKVIVSWSLNPDRLHQEEKNAPLLGERLEAARKCAEQGYLIGFHFDPLINYPGWENDYKKTVEHMFSVVSGSHIAWISLGALRYPSFMDTIIRKQNPDSRIFLGELFPGIDGKLRYFRPLRVKMFQKMIQWIQAIDPKVLVYLCMESKEVWNAVFPVNPLKNSSLPRLLDRAFLKFQ